MITESELEQLALTWFQDSGWEYRHGPDIAVNGDTPERSDRAMQDDNCSGLLGSSSEWQAAGESYG